MDEKFCLKWNDFYENIREYFRILRKDQRLFDVTLATEDGHQIQAHKIILSAGSHFFSDIFLKNNHTNMLIYLKGISSAELEHVTDFIYNGEASITQEEMNNFLETGKELKVKGLLSQIQGVQETVSDDQKYNSDLTEAEYLNGEHLISQEDFHHSVGKNQVKFGSQETTLMKTGTELGVDTELDNQVEEMIEKSDGLWRCKVCGKSTRGQKQVMKQHVEIHIEGVSHACHICSKTFRTRPHLRCHVSNNHSELVSCNYCGKSGMTRSAYNNHKQKCK